jgi:hypothetical protein
VLFGTSFVGAANTSLFVIFMPRGIAGLFPRRIKLLAGLPSSSA